MAKSDAFMKVVKQLKIKPKGGKLISFTPNRHQAELFKRIKNNRLAGVPTREIHVKDRQVGDTTGIAAFMYADCNVNPATEALIVVNNDTTLKKVWRIYDRFIKHHGYDQGLEENDEKKRPRYHSLKHWTHQDNDSSISIELASDEASRGGSALHFHGSEVDYWDHFDEAFESIMAQVPDVPESVAILETTFDGGRSAEFRDFVLKALAGENDWTVVFIGWLEHEEYTRPFPSQSKRDSFEQSLTPEEQEIRQRYSVPLEKMNWRRYTIQNKFRGEANRFRKSFPIDVHEAMRFKGDGYFTANAIQHLTERVRGPVMELVPEIDPVTDTPRMYHPEELGYLPSSHEDAEDRLFVWDPPKANVKYIIGMDVADSPDNVQYGHAKSVAVVIEADTGSVVARWAGKIAPITFADIGSCMGHYYNKALLVPERNNMGITVVDRLIEKAYPRLYATDKLGYLPDGTMKVSNKIGFETTPKTRPVLLRKLQDTVNGHRMEIPDTFIVEQMMGFVDKKGAGQPRRKYKGEDDAVIAMALAVWAAHKKDQWARRAAADAYVVWEQEKVKLEQFHRATNPTIDELKARIRKRERNNKSRYSSMFGRREAQ